MRQTDTQTIFTDVIATIVSSPTKITPSALEKLIFEKYGLNRKQSKTVIRDLVFSGELTYTYEFGSTFLERSFTKPVRISRYVLLTPPGYPYRPKPKDVLVQIKPGAAFGIGRHPSTRLAISSRWELTVAKFKSWVGTVSTGQRRNPSTQASYNSLSCVK